MPLSVEWAFRRTPGMRPTPVRFLLPSTRPLLRHRSSHPGHPRTEKLVVIMGATGTGKTRLSIDLATHFAGEVINCDKIQVYRGLDITTNKVPLSARHGIPHHLLGELDPTAGELTPAAFRARAATAITAIAGRGRLPVVAGGSNSFIQALMEKRSHWQSFLIWVDIEEAVLGEYLDRRVEEMIRDGMVAELEHYFALEEKEKPGLGKAIGVAEFREYFEKGRSEEAYKEAVKKVKESTRRLAAEQAGKIRGLAARGWEMQRLDATAAVRARIEGGGRAAETAAWERDVVGPSKEAVRVFLGKDRAPPQRFCLPRGQAIGSVS